MRVQEHLGWGDLSVLGASVYSLLGYPCLLTETPVPSDPQSPLHLTTPPSSHGQAVACEFQLLGLPTL